MPFEKGHTKAKGRPKGSSNIASSAAREAIALFVDNNAPRLQGWLDRIAQENPKEAFSLFQSVIEYHIPKLARSEHTGKDGGDLKAIMEVRLIPGTADITIT